MSKILSFFKTLRNHWKKSTVGVLIISYGVNYGYDKFRTHQLIKNYCIEARKYGEVPLPLGAPSRQITVLLNPAANGGKAKAEFEKYCAPLLYLSGMKISVVKTESIGEARGLMNVMDNCDGIVVAGGDGALSEAITGLLRREDGSSAAQRFPFGVIPLGKNNNVAKSIFKQFKDDRIQLMAEATMAVLRDVQHPIDVMKVEVLAADGSEEVAGKVIYAASQLQWGAFRDVDDRIGKYWFWGPLRSYAAYFFGAFKDLTWNCAAKFRYTLPCDGCNRCKNQQKLANVSNQPQATSRWWSVFVPRTPITNSIKQEKDYSQIVNPDCGVWLEKDLSTVEFETLTANNPRFGLPNQPKHLEITLGPGNLGMTDFIKEGWLRAYDKTFMKREKIQVKEFVMIPNAVKDTSPPVVSGDGEKKAVQEEKWYSIDNDNYEVKSVKATLLPDAIKVFGQSYQR